MEKISKAQIKLVRSLQQKKFRDELGLFVAEGDKCIEELRKSFELVHLYCEGENATRTEIEQMSGLKTPQGVIGVFKKRDLSPFTFHLSPLILALDGIQDPGNLGTIIRTADWFGVRDIICSLDTADCYNPKVVQATMGALARVHLHYVDLPKWLSGIRNPESGIKIYGTLLRRLEISRSRRLDDYHRHGQRRQRHLTRRAVSRHPTHPDPFVSKKR